MKKGILLMNLGGPSALEDVEPFLYRLFSDPEVLVGIPSPFRQGLAYLISKVKSKSSKEMYRQIGGGSPQLFWMKRQAELLTEKSAADSVRVEVGMRTSEPSIETAVRALRDWGAEKIVFFPLFPQFSKATSGSCVGEARRVIRSLKWNPEVKSILSWPDHPGYIELIRLTIQGALTELPKDQGSHVLFSAHSLPKSILKRGDPYLSETLRTIDAAAQGLKFPWSIAFQSRNGPIPWLEPDTAEEIKRLAATGVKSLLVVPVSFVSDHIETLYELDILYRDLALSCGIEIFKRTRSFNDDSRFTEILRSILNAGAAN